jgi:hypothetical protein
VVSTTTGQIEGSVSWRIAGFSSTRILKPAQKTAWRIESISVCVGSASGLR